MCQQLAGLTTAIRGFAARFDPSLLSGADVARVVTHAAAIEHIAATIKSLAAARAAEAKEWKQDGYRSAEEQLAHTTGTSLGQAREAITLGRRLVQQPDVDAAAREGKISPTQASAISDAVAADASAAPGLLNAAAAGGSLVQLKSQCAHVKAAVTDREARRRAIHDRRHLRSWTDPQGEWHLVAGGNPEDGAQIMAALAPLAEEAFNTARPQGPTEHADAYRFDALVQLATEATSTDDDSETKVDGSIDCHPGDSGNGHAPEDIDDASAEGRDATRLPGRQAPSHPTRPREGRRTPRARKGAPVKLVIRVDLDAFLRGFPTQGETCELVGYGPISVSALHDTLKDGDPFVAAILTKGKQLAGVAHLGRKPTAHQRSFLQWIYPTCAAQGCPHTAHLQIDHRHDWSQTHITIIDWLDALCHHHHQLKTQQNWSLTDGIGKRPFVPPTDSRHPCYKPPSGHG